eukprot:TRINITY_DN10700_c0_g3_i1.p1 TRINITY_DN10700_c0_g3~~TRINITY_DN10700_c0_g3_i1.p1  ORF type:complete len:182 (+),score=35.21 TRINITY_DN10700_c0_g3_i1:158-703(+)
MVTTKPRALRRLANLVFSLAALALGPCLLKSACEPAFSMFTTSMQALQDQRKKIKSAPETDSLKAVQSPRRAAILGVPMLSLMTAPAARARDMDSKIRDAGLDREAGNFRTIDINTATADEYRQFPGMFPTIGSFIAQNKPYKAVKDIYSKPEFNDAFLRVLKKYEKFLTVEIRENGILLQ